jgi:hypothetical protein
LPDETDLPLFNVCRLAAKRARHAMLLRKFIVLHWRGDSKLRNSVALPIENSPDTG